MKSLIVFYKNNSLQTELQDIPVPSPGPNEVLIKVRAAGSNPKDYKHPLPGLYNNALNQGDDCAGTVAAVGTLVQSFHVGDRVAGFHVMDTPHGTYAEYALCPENTVFRIPQTMSFEEAATIPLAAYTAAVGLYRSLELSSPFDRTDDQVLEVDQEPLVVNGGSTAVGSFAIKLAKLNPRIGPIIATAGSSAGYVKSLEPDAVVDYRSATIAEDLKQALRGKAARYVFDASNSPRSVEYLASIMEPGGRYSCTSKLYANASLGVDDSMENSLRDAGVWYENAFVGDVHDQPFRIGGISYAVKPGGKEFGAAMSSFFEKSVANGMLKGHPFELVKGGLHGVLEALMELKQRKQGGNAKFVTRIEDTCGLG
jgi:NADPH:quinone reductase